MIEFHKTEVRRHRRRTLVNAINRLNRVIEQARQQGIEIRYEMLGGSGGGYCQLGSRHILFVDLSLSTSEQLEKLLGDFALSSRIDNSETLNVELDNAPSVRKAA